MECFTAGCRLHTFRARHDDLPLISFALSFSPIVLALSFIRSGLAFFEAHSPSSDTPLICDCPNSFLEYTSGQILRSEFVQLGCRELRCTRIVSVGFEVSLRKALRYVLNSRYFSFMLVTDGLCIMVIDIAM